MSSLIHARIGAALGGVCLLGVTVTLFRSISTVAGAAAISETTQNQINGRLKSCVKLENQLSVGQTVTDGRTGNYFPIGTVVCDKDNRTAVLGPSLTDPDGVPQINKIEEATQN